MHRSRSAAASTGGSLAAEAPGDVADSRRAAAPRKLLMSGHRRDRDRTDSSATPRAAHISTRPASWSPTSSSAAPTSSSSMRDQLPVDAAGPRAAGTRRGTVRAALAARPRHRRDVLRLAAQAVGARNPFAPRAAGAQGGAITAYGHGRPRAQPLRRAGRADLQRRLGPHVRGVRPWARRRRAARARGRRPRRSRSPSARVGSRYPWRRGVSRSTGSTSRRPWSRQLRRKPGGDRVPVTIGDMSTTRVGGRLPPGLPRLQHDHQPAHPGRAGGVLPHRRRALAPGGGVRHRGLRAPAASDAARADGGALPRGWSARRLRHRRRR